MEIPNSQYELKKPIRVKCVINTLPDSAYLNKYDSLEVVIKKIVARLDKIIIGPPPPPSGLLLFAYGATLLDTTVADYMENEYVISVNAIFNANQQLIQNFVPAVTTVTITNFANISDKVLFIQIPSTEAPFTKWSEVGNLFQQDANIDSNFAGNGVWFKTTRGNSTLYMTRSQTTFTGAVILSR